MTEGRLAQIEDLIIATLKEDLPGVHVDTRSTSLSEDGLRSVLTLAPFVLIEYNGGNPVMEVNVGSAGTKVGFNLFVGAKSLRSKKEAQRGSYGMLSQIRESLDGTELSESGVVAGPFVWEGEAIFLDTNEGTIYQTVYSLTE
jgi:phage gp37-like protein